MQKMLDVYVEKVLNIIYDDEPIQYGIIDLGYTIDGMDCSLYSHFVYEKQDIGFTISILLKDPYAHQFRIEQFDRWDYRIECGSDNHVIRFIKRKEDEMFDKEIELNRSYTKSWKVDMNY